jgi:hypothetical protein
MPRLIYHSSVPAKLRGVTDDIAARLDQLLEAHQSQWRLTINAPPDGSYLDVVLWGDRLGKEIVLPHRFEGGNVSLGSIVDYFRAALSRAGLEFTQP